VGTSAAAAALSEVAVTPIETAPVDVAPATVVDGSWPKLELTDSPSSDELLSSFSARAASLEAAAEDALQAMSLAQVRVIAARAWETPEGWRAQRLPPSLSILRGQKSNQAAPTSNACAPRRAGGGGPP
jgi:hypothetical protein